MRLIRLFKRELAQESTAWVGANIITTAQAEQICKLYGIDYHAQDQRTYGYFILVALGYLFLGLALLLLISNNWQEIPRAVRMLGLVGLTLATNAYGVYKANRREHSTAVIVLFFGGLCYGAAIMLIAQIYHLGEHFPDGIYWWALGVLPMALLLDSSLLMLLAVVLAFIWWFTETSLDFYPLSFPVFIAAMAWHCFRVKQSNVLFMLLVVAVVLWLEYSLAWLAGDGRRFEFEVDHLAFGTSLFFVSYAVAKWLVTRQDNVRIDYGTLLAIWTLRFALIALLVFSFKEPWRVWLHAYWKMPGLSLTIACLVPPVALAWLLQMRQAIAPVASFGLLYFATLLASISGHEYYATGLQIIDNLLLVMSGIWLIVRGIEHSISHYFFLGILVILLTGLLRYIDLVGDYVGASILFAVFACILLAAASFWKTQHGLQRGCP